MNASAPDPAGILNIAKPAGPTSFAAVSRVRRILRVKRVGHCGTLDPMAEGVLVVLFGAATRRQEEFMAGEKVYRATLRLGLRTDSGDLEGKVLETAEPPALAESAVRAAFGRFTGDILQTPPMYSALKHRGRPLHDYARKGLTVERKARPVTIFSIEPLALRPGEIELRVTCSKGTYIRTLAEDIARELGTCGALSRLVRERSGSFALEDALSWEELSRLDRKTLLARALPLPS